MSGHSDPLRGDDTGELIALVAVVLAVTAVLVFFLNLGTP